MADVRNSHLHDDCLVNDTAVLLANALAWPVTVLILSIILLITQRGAIGGLFGRIKSAKYPGGEAQFLPESAAVDTISSLVDVLSANVRESLILKTAESTAGDHDGVEPIPNREPVGEFRPLPAGDVTNLVTLRTKMGNLLSELAFPLPPGSVSVRRTIEVLRNRNVLDRDTADNLERTMEIADQAASGMLVPEKVTWTVRNNGEAILDQFARLRTFAAARFEDHVLDVLEQTVPAGWRVDVDSRIGDAATGRGALVDAVVTDGERRAIVEVRARLHAGSRGQLNAFSGWLAALPSDVPVLLVLPGGGLDDRELGHLRAGRDEPIEMLLWDVESGSLITRLRRLLTSRD